MTKLLHLQSGLNCVIIYDIFLELIVRRTLILSTYFRCTLASLLQSRHIQRTFTISVNGGCGSAILFADHWPRHAGSMSVALHGQACLVSPDSASQSVARKMLLFTHWMKISEKNARKKSEDLGAQQLQEVQLQIQSCTACWWAPQNNINTYKHNVVKKQWPAFEIEKCNDRFKVEKLQELKHRWCLRRRKLIRFCSVLEPRVHHSFGLSALDKKKHES